MARGIARMIVDAIYRNRQGRGTTTGNDGEESDVHVAVTAGRLLEREMGLDLSVGGASRKAGEGEGSGGGRKGGKPRLEQSKRGRWWRLWRTGCGGCHCPAAWLASCGPGAVKKGWRLGPTLEKKEKAKKRDFVDVGGFRM